MFYSIPDNRNKTPNISAKFIALDDAPNMCYIVGSVCITVVNVYWNVKFILMQLNASK